MKRKNVNKNTIKKVKGITLISLVITIIILLILAGVTISLTLGDNGIITQAQKAKEAQEIAAIKEDIQLAILDKELEKGGTGLTKEELEEIAGNYGEIQEDGNTIKTEDGYEIKIDEIYQEEVVTGGNEVTDNEVIITLQERLEKLEQTVAEIENNSNQTIDNIYPVGSIYISTDLSTTEEVSNKLGGTWEAYGQGRTLIGIGTGTDSNSISQEFAANETGGEYTHILTTAEMPKHRHSLKDSANRVPASWPINGNGSWGWNTGWVSNTSPHMDGINDTQYAGNSQAHNNIQPYITVYMWKRIS